MRIEDNDDWVGFCYCKKGEYKLLYLPLVLVLQKPFEYNSWLELWLITSLTNVDQWPLSKYTNLLTIHNLASIRAKFSYNWLYFGKCSRFCMIGTEKHFFNSPSEKNHETFFVGICILGCPQGVTWSKSISSKKDWQRHVFPRFWIDKNWIKNVKGRWREVHKGENAEKVVIFTVSPLIIFW